MGMWVGGWVSGGAGGGWVTGGDGIECGGGGGVGRGLDGYVGGWVGGWVTGGAGGGWVTGGAGDGIGCVWLGGGV